MRKQFYNLLICILLVGINQVNAQIFPSFGKTRVATTGMQFLKVYPDARSASLSGTYHSMANDVAALYWNPAGITRVDSMRLHIQAGYTQYFSDINLSSAGLVWRKNQTHFFGLQVASFNSGVMNVTTEFNPTGTGQTYTVNDFVIGGTYAQILTDNFSYGITTKFAHEGIGNISTNNVLFDFGLQYNVGWQDIRFSVGFNNFGFNVTPEGKIDVLTINGKKEISNYEELSVPAVFRVGLSKDFIKKKDHQLTGAFQLNHPTDNSETYGLGVEYLLRNVLYLRTGYEFGRSSVSYPSAGIGLKLQKNYGGLKIDYGMSNQQYLGYIHRITLGISIK